MSVQVMVMLNVNYQFSSAQFNFSVVSDSLRPHESQHTRPPCPSPTPRVHSDSCPSIQWCHPAISSSVIPFSSCPQSLPAAESFPMSQLFAWGGQSIGVWALASVLPMNTQSWSPLEQTGWISLQSKGLSRVFSNTTVQSYPIICDLMGCSPLACQAPLLIEFPRKEYRNGLPFPSTGGFSLPRDWPVAPTLTTGRFKHWAA